MTYKNLFSYTRYLYCALLLMSFTSCHLDKNRNNYNRAPHIPPHSTKNNANPRLTWAGRLEITSHSQYRKLLRSHHVCDRGSLINIGHYSCKSWDTRADVHIQFTKTKLPAEATLIIQPYIIGAATSIVQSGFNSIRLRGQVYPIASSKGFRLTLQKSAAHSQGFSLLPPTTNIMNVVVESDVNSPSKDATLSVVFYYGSAGREDSKFGQAELINKTMDSKDSSGFSYQR